MKKMLMIVLAGLLAAPLAACGTDKHDGGDAKMNKAKASSTQAKAAKADKSAKTVANAKAKATKS